MQKIELTIDLVNALLNYLGSRPFVEVANLINRVQEEAKGQEPESAEAAEVLEQNC